MRRGAGAIPVADAGSFLRMVVSTPGMSRRGTACTESQAAVAYA